MMVSREQLATWLNSKEDEHLEFKEAKTSFHFEKLAKYCAALANEGGGSIVLGVTDSRPRRVVDSQAFRDLERTKAGLIERLRLRVEGEEIMHHDRRVLVLKTHIAVYTRSRCEPKPAVFQPPSVGQKRIPDAYPRVLRTAKV